MHSFFRWKKRERKFINSKNSVIFFHIFKFFLKPVNFLEKLQNKSNMFIQNQITILNLDKILNSKRKKL